MKLPEVLGDPAAIVTNRWGTKRIVDADRVSKKDPGKPLASAKTCLHGHILDPQDHDWPCPTCVFEVSKLAGSR